MLIFNDVTYSMFLTGRQKVYAHSSGLKDLYDFLRRTVYLTYSMFVTGRQQIFAHSSGLKDFYDLKHVAFFHFVRVILIFGF